ncbi:MAG: hypothetical protein GY829_12650 [Gammaproteobacteria bacterium]|nr:hypothetical protein [Gammaproteobacteria bacterium]
MKQEIENLGGDFTKPEWQWLLNNGPHGTSFTWSQTKSEPAGCVGVELLEEFVQEKSENSDSFRKAAEVMITQALESNNTNILIRAIQVGAVIGSEKELKVISTLTKHPEDLVFKNAKASVFYLKKRLKSQVN